MKFLLMVFVIAFASIGCSSIKQRAETSGTNRVTTIEIRTLWDAKAVIDKIRASNGATHSLGANGVAEESSSKSLESIAKGLVEGAIASGGGGVPVGRVKQVDAPISQDQIEEAVRKVFSKTTNAPPK